ncbi:RING finger and transmembrane domain-containing protein 2-like [Homarus americanus]|uniref:RING finger and transmembrane domain-containing protein 2-like n=1 Tax=Homarus americanus TaxID=6706 RepID=UPI001C476129|nr:RING finger and transmembrane domain-containing protein 2-like [Homarus americanus]XP_042239336.1 RING finger and transmembrane domain-containing protein 2-like [Homarus americanus]
MAGHGRPISPEEVNRTERSVLPISLTSRLQTNTWRQVFTSLRPLVAQTRQRTLSTYARRLHQRQHDVQFRRPQLEGEEQQSLLYPHPPDLHGETNRGARGTDNMNNVIIDIEDGNSYVSHSQNIPDIPVPPQLLHTEPHNSNLPTDNIHGSVSASSTVEGSGSSFTTSSTSEPLLPMSGTTASVDEGGNAAETAHNDATGASTNRSEGESLTELLSQFPEVRSGLLVAWHYCIFFSIILAKALFDHLTGLMVVLTLVVGFMWSNNIVKKAVAQQGRRPIKPLLALLVNLPAGVFFLYYSYRSDKLFYSVLLIPPDHEGYGVMDLMWIVIVSDYVLKLVTVLVKAVITLMPHSLMHYQNRGKYFLVVEMGSQLYRSLAPIQPWLSYLLDGYAGPRKVLGIFLSATYMVCKGPDIVTKMKCFQAAIVKFINSVNYGCTPSKSQLEDAGGLCPICHDDFLLPTMLRCKHIFCEQCVVTWFDRERTCPMCRTQVADDPAWRDGSTSHFLQVY